MKQVQILTEGDAEIMETRLNDELVDVQDGSISVSGVVLHVTPRPDGTFLYTAMIVYDYLDEPGGSS